MNKDKIKLLTDDMIQLGTMKVTPKNKVLDITNGVISFAVNGNRVGKIDVEDYCKLNLWSNRMTYTAADPVRGVIAYHTGFEHKSLGSAIMNTKFRRVKFKNGNSCDYRKQNLVVLDE